MNAAGSTSPSSTATAKKPVEPSLAEECPQLLVESLGPQSENPTFSRMKEEFAKGLGKTLRECQKLVRPTGVEPVTS